MLREEERKRRNRKGSNCSIYMYRWLQWGQENSEENNTDLHDQRGGRGEHVREQHEGRHVCTWVCMGLQDCVDPARGQIQTARPDSARSRRDINYNLVYFINSFTPYYFIS